MAVPPISRDPLSIFAPPEKSVVDPTSNVLVRWSDKLLRLGISGYDRDTRRRLLLVNMAGYLSAFSSLSFAINFSIYNFQPLIWLVLVNLLSAIVTATVPFWHRFNAVVGPIVMTAMVASSLFFFVSELGRDSGIQLNYIGSVAIAFVIFGLGHMRLIAGVTVICIIGHLSTFFMFPEGRVQGAVDDAFLAQTYILSATTIMIILALVVWYSFRVAAEAEARAERLLANVLPEAIAERLMLNPDHPIADRFDEATVLFADLVGFTELSEKVSAGEMLYLLNEVFSEFDALGNKHQTEKIKTIGDSYMAVSGVPDLADNHAERIVRQAVEMLEVAERVSIKLGHPLRLRIGIATGPITAGVIGTAKFAYDVWAPTVNLASRLESTGQIGRIRVSKTTHKLLKDKFDFDSAGPADLKGIGRVRSWYLKQG